MVHLHYNPDLENNTLTIGNWIEYQFFNGRIPGMRLAKLASSQRETQE
jgi:hypothetical protein